MRTPARGVRALQRQRVLVEERPAAVIGRHVDDVAEAEPEQDAPLHPRVDPPARRRRGVGLGGADARRRTSAARKRGERLRAPLPCATARRCGEERSIVRLQRSPCVIGRRTRRGSRRCRAATSASIFVAARPAAAAPSAAGRPLRAGPSPPSRTSPGSGFDSTKLTCISGSSCVVHARARAAKSPRSASSTMLRHLRRHLVRRHRDDAAAADRHQRQRQRVVAREHDEVVRHGAADLAHLRDVARRFLDADDVRNRGQARAASPASMLQPVRPGTL